MTNEPDSAPPSTVAAVDTNAIEQDALAAVAAAASPAELEDARVRYLGRKSDLKQALAATPEGVLVVARMDVVHRGMITELERLLGTMPCAKLGLIVAGAGADSSYGYGYASYYGRPEPEPQGRRRLRRRGGTRDKDRVG